MRCFKGARTYGELIKLVKPSCYNGTCCACHNWGRTTWQLSTRASICEDCCKRKADETLGPIVTAERKARRWVRNHPNLHGEPQFIVNLSGASMEFVQSEIARHAKRSKAEAA